MAKVKCVAPDGTVIELEGVDAREYVEYHGYKMPPAEPAVVAEHEQIKEKAAAARVVVERGRGKGK